MIDLGDDQPESARLGRRDFVKLSAVLAGLAGAYALTRPSVHEYIGNLAENVTNEFKMLNGPNDPSKAGIASSVTSIDYVANSIALKINDAINHSDKARRSLEYRTAYDLYNEAIADSRKEADNAGSSHSNYPVYRGLEVVATMWRSLLLLGSQSNNIIVSNEKTIIKDLPTITSRTRLNDADQKNNLYKALEGYERVQEILEEQENGVKLPFYVGQGILGERGLVASADIVQQRIDQTVDTLIRNHVPGAYIPKLLAKKSQ